MALPSGSAVRLAPSDPASPSAFAKAARGAMARHVLEHDIQLPEQLTGFCGLGYAHNPEKSAPGLLVFTRPSRP